MDATVHIMFVGIVTWYVHPKNLCGVPALIRVGAYSLASHAALDLIPHIEPDAFNFTYGTSWGGGETWALISNVLGAAILAYYLIMVPKLRRWMTLIVASAFSWGPDFLYYLTLKNVVHGTVIDWFRWGHETAHAWKTDPLANNIATGCLLTLIALFICWMLLQTSLEEAKHERRFPKTSLAVT